MATRYVAEWIACQHYDNSGEWQPDLDERESKEFQTLDAAIKHARKKGEDFGWARVGQEESRACADDLGRFSMWDEVKSWTYDGWVWNENRSGA